MIFLVRDIREEERDRLICQHVMGVHIDHSSSAGDTVPGDFEEGTRCVPMAVVVVCTYDFITVESRRLEWHMAVVVGLCASPWDGVDYRRIASTAG